MFAAASKMIPRACLGEWRSGDTSVVSFTAFSAGQSDRTVQATGLAVK